MNPKSSTLFHFTKTIETLKQILKNGFWPQYSVEDIKWIGYEKIHYVAFPMVCFCNIPLSRINEHVKFYGSYGIGLTRDWALQKNLNPLLYVSSSSRLRKSFVELIDISLQLKGAQHTLATRDLRSLIAHTKPISGTMLISGSQVTKEFYQESEWRYVPQHRAVRQFAGDYQLDKPDKMAQLNESAKIHCSLKFSPKDVRYIFVKTEADIPNVIKFIEKGLGKSRKADLRILASRVVSIEDISKDL